MIGKFPKPIDKPAEIEYHIYVTGKKGSIIGGYAYAISGMDVNVIGNSTD